MAFIANDIRKLCLAIVAALFVACDSEDFGVTDYDDRAITLSYGTRSTSGVDETQFMSGETIWLWATGSTNITAWKLVADGNGGIASSTQYYWPKDGTTLQATAIHGNFTTTPTEGTTSWSGSFTHTVMAEQTSEENYRQSDLLYCSATIGQWQSSNILKFEHQLAKVEVTLSPASSNSITEQELSNATVTLNNIKPSAIFDVSTSSVTASGSVCNVTMGNVFSSNANVREAIVPGQTLTNLQFTVTFKTQGTPRTLTCKTSSSVTFLKKNKYKYTLTLYNDKITLSPVSVTPFNEETKDESFKIYVDP